MAGTVGGCDTVLQSNLSSGESTRRRRLPQASFTVSQRHSSAKRRLTRPWKSTALLSLLCVSWQTGWRDGIIYEDKEGGGGGLRSGVAGKKKKQLHSAKIIVGDNSISLSREGADAI